MKTKLYILLTVLLMAACITSYGQEIVSEFLIENSPEFDFMYTDIVENSDGTLLIGTTSHRGYYEEYYVIYKITPEGELIDSISMDAAAIWYMIEHPTEPDTYLLPGFLWNNTNHTYDFHLTSMDANFNLSEEIVVPISNEHFSQMIFPFSCPMTPDGNLLIPYWTPDQIFHIVCIAPNGAIVTNKSFTDLPPTYDYDHEGLLYSNFGILNYSPVQYYLMGGRPSLESPAWPITVYVFNDKFNITEEHHYEVFDENTYIDQLSLSYIIPIATETKGNFLMAVSTITDEGAASSLVKYDMNDNPVAMVRLEPGNGDISAGTPYRTIITEGNTIFHAHQSCVGNKLERLDSNLNVDWELILPTLPTTGYMFGQCMKVLHDGSIALGLDSRSSNNNTLASCLKVLIIHDGYDATPEITGTNKSFIFFPNPVKDQLSLRFDDGAMPESVELYDLAGRLVGTKPNVLETIDMSAMPAGVYMLRVTMKDGTCYHEKLVKR